ncbi:hypothetical protein H5410_052002, partial [Solanum commersonii]
GLWVGFRVLYEFGGGGLDFGDLMLVLVCLRLPKMILVDLVFHYGGKCIREPKLLYERKLVHKWKGYDSDLLSYINITNEYINLLGYVGVQ